MCCWCFSGYLYAFVSFIFIKSTYQEWVYRPAFNVRSHSHVLLSEIREPVWSYIINLCSSFTARDCNACFSQIFEKRTFGYLNEEEESLFRTLRTFDSFCSSCSNFVTVNSSILLTVVTAYGLNQSGLDNNIWPLFATKMHTNPGRLNCTNCHSNFDKTLERLIFQQLYAYLYSIQIHEQIIKSGDSSSEHYF